MIISVTQIVIIGDKRIERTASAQIDRVGITEILQRPDNALRRREQISETARALFDTLELPPS